MTIDLAPQGGRAPDDGLGSERQDDGRAPKVVIIGAGPAGLTAAAQLVERGVCPSSSRPMTSSAASAGPSSATVGASTSVATGSSPRSPEVERLVARHAARRRVHGATADEPDLLRRQVLRLPAEGVERAAQPRHRQVADVRAVVRVGAPLAARRHVDVRGLGLVALRAPPVPRRSSRPTPRRCGACPPTRCRRTGRRSGSRACRSASPIVNALMPKRNQKEITSLIEEFHYPQLGPGMMWETCHDVVVKGAVARCAWRQPGGRHRTTRRAAPSTVRDGDRSNACPATR